MSKDGQTELSANLTEGHFTAIKTAEEAARLKFSGYITIIYGGIVTKIGLIRTEHLRGSIETLNAFVDDGRLSLGLRFRVSMDAHIWQPTGIEKECNN